MVLLRDPTGDGKVYNKDWKYNDPNWTTALKATVPYGLDPTLSKNYDNGIFAAPLEQFLTAAGKQNCFEYAYIAHVRNYATGAAADGNYKVTKFDFDEYDGTNKWYKRFGQTTSEVEVLMGSSKSGDWYFQVETYPLGMVPQKCIKYTTGGNTFKAPNINYSVTQNGNNVWT